MPHWNHRIVYADMKSLPPEKPSKEDLEKLKTASDEEVLALLPKTRWAPIEDPIMHHFYVAECFYQDNGKIMISGPQSIEGRLDSEEANIDSISRALKEQYDMMASAFEKPVLVLSKLVESGWVE